MSKYRLKSDSSVVCRAVVAEDSGGQRPLLHVTFESSGVLLYLPKWFFDLAFEEVPEAVEEEAHRESAWVQEHEPNGLWHFFEDQTKPALCGQDPIPGMPLMSMNLPEGTVYGPCCEKCLERFKERLQSMKAEYPAPPAETCETCRFSHLSFSECYAGECHRRAPIRGEGGRSEFPGVHKGWWCGEWEGKADG